MQALCMFLRSTWQKTLDRNMLREGCVPAFPSVPEEGTQGSSPCSSSASRGPAACTGQGFANRQGKRIAGCNLKARAMGCEPTQFALVKLESVSTAGMTETALKASFKIHETENACLDQPAV